MALVTVGYLLGWVLHLVAIALLPLYLAQMAIGGIPRGDRADGVR